MSPADSMLNILEMGIGMREVLKKTVCIVLLCALALGGGTAVPGRVQAVGVPTVDVTTRNSKNSTITIGVVGESVSYKVYLAKSKKGKYKLKGTTDAATYKITGLKPKQVYYVKVRAFETVDGETQYGGYSSIKKIPKYTVGAAYVNQVLKLVNKERAKAGVPELKLDARLTKAAQIRSRELVQKFSHTRPDGRDCLSALIDEGLDYSVAGENIAAGQQTPKQVVASWMASSGHRANILMEDYEYMGLGYTKSSKGYQYYWSQMFMAPGYSE